ncbi:hypothetical protein GPECTOR_355g118 [Gonium pectorale]|uniref:FHA domain-containing protein n=1 Tax=Gonium pectorale TaxID=33097 RepID=A0A150FVM8_GONPE|nr:hypothetical protein GPECTOR_355g118 [Gonium pectorale]|eukprot:KXZ41628.1 hypothetical protein GPECTOR_355g118 [Gonium pectorale]
MCVATCAAGGGGGAQPASQRLYARVWIYDTPSALACLAGRAARYYLRSTVVILGRTTESKGDVDLDLAAEEAAVPRPAPTAGAGADGSGAPAATGAAEQGAAGAAATSAAPPAGAVGAATTAAAAAKARVSRRAAMIRLGPDGQFRLVNTGRQTVVVNDVEVPPHRATTLPHLSLVRVADVRLLFMANPAAVARCVRRSAALVL